MTIQEGHRWLKAEEGSRELETDQKKRLPHPPLQKPAPEGAELIELVPPEGITLGEVLLREAIARRRSRRRFSSDPLTPGELSFLLWAT